MKARTSFLKRCLAFALALVLLASSTNMGVVANAADNDKTVQIAQIVANNYDLTAAEKALLESGKLAGGAYGYDLPGEDLVKVDTEKKEITAEQPDGWVATEAKIIAGGSTAETVTLTDGKGNYAYAGNNFSVEVNYVLNEKFDEDVQNQLLGTAGWLKSGVAAVKAVYAGTDSNLGTIALAVPTLEDLADGITMNLGFEVSVQLGDAAQKAVAALSDEMADYGGKLALEVYNAAYGNASSKTEYLLNNGKAFHKVAEETYANLKAIKEDELLSNSILDSYLKGYDDAAHIKWMAMKSILGNVVKALEEALAADWTAAEKGAALVTGYEGLDKLVADLDEISKVTVKNPLKVDEVTVSTNLNMNNVTVNVVLKVVEDKADSAELVVKDTVTEVVTLSTGATAEQIVAEAQTVIEAALAKWTDVPIADHFGAAAPELPDALVEDITYTVTYAPKVYTIDLGYAEDMTVPYGYKYTLPKHENAEQAYDYTVNGEKKAQGEVVAILGNTVITRTAGKSYVATDLYTVVANNYGDDVAKAILTSGALNGNVAISYREPDPTDAESLLELLAPNLTAKNYNSDFKGKAWAPYTYGANGTENKFSGNTATWTEKSVKVQYKLDVDTKEKAQEVLNLAKTLKAEAAEQKSAMDSLLGMKDTLQMLDKTKLGALNGVIDVTDFSADPAENAEIKAQMKTVVGNIINNNLDSNNFLKIYNMVTAYEQDGMAYYYKNYAVIKAEVEGLAGYMGELMDNEEALRTMCSAAGFPEYAEKISGVEESLNTYNAKLSAPNAAINLSSAGLGKLVTALTMEGDAACTAAGAPYVLSKILTAMDDSQVNVQVIIETPNGGATVTTATMDRGTVMTQNMVDDLKALINAKVAELLGEGNAKYYNLTVEGTAIDELANKALDAKVNIYYTYSEKEYTVKIDGEADQIVKISDLEIALPKHATNGWVYKYTVDDVEGITASTYTFTLEQIDRLFTGGSYTITRTESNEAAEKLEGTFADWLVKDKDGNITGLHAQVAGDQGGLMDFANRLLNSGYSYIGLNGKPLMYLNTENTLEICLQTLIDAILEDNSFSQQTLIDLGTNGKGKLVQAKSLQLGNSADDIFFSDLDFTFTLTSVPAQMAKVANGLKTLAPYIRFNSNNGVMEVKLDMPKPVYAAYLAAMVSIGEVDENNINEINSEIAYDYLWNFVEAIIDDDSITTTTYTNTLKKLGINKDLTGAEEYYQMVRKAVNGGGVKINPDENGVFDMSVTGKSQKAINSLIGFLGIDVSGYSTYLGMIKEYKYEDAELTANCNAILVDAEEDIDALLIDMNASGVANKIECTTDLAARIKTAANNCVVVLLDNVKGDIVFPGNTILDLNGHTIDGDVSAKNRLYIIDSNMVTANEGGITGSVKATAILAGTYNADVSKYLVSGYKQVKGVVQNALYTVEGTETAYNYVVNTDFMGEDISYTTFAPALAVDMTVDVILNYYTAAAMSVDGNKLYQLDFTDLITLITAGNTKYEKVEDVVNKVLGCIGVPGIGETAELFLEDLLNFAAIRDGLNAGTPVAKHTITTAPMDLVINHKADGDYMDIGFGPVQSKAKDVEVGITFVGSNKYLTAFKNLVTELAEIVTTEVNIVLEQPELVDKKIEAIGEFEASADIDMATDDYRTIVGVILAYSKNDANIAKAVNAKDWTALKGYVDNASVADIFTALKKLSRNVKFADMAEAVGVTVSGDAAKIESAYHYILCAAGKILEELDITGYPNKKMGALYDESTGLYVLDKKEFTKSADVTKRGFTAYAKLTLGDFVLRVDLWSEDDCLWGDVNHDGKVNPDDALLTFQHYLGNDTFGNFVCEEKANVYQDGAINPDDAFYIAQYYLGNIAELPVDVK